MTLRTTLALAGMSIAMLGASASARSLPVEFNPPFTQTFSNISPLTFGMTADDTARALATPLHYLSGRPGDEVFLAIRTIGGGGFFPRNDRLFLQFRRGRLTGFKGDWGRNWMWR